jgi:uncharacterized glyoxalase superfamily protein PhnB
MVKYSYTILYVSNVYRSISFYEAALGLTKRFVHESGQYAELETDTTTLALAANELARSNLPQGFQENSRAHLPTGIEIGFVTDDVRGIFDRALKFGAEAVVEPKVKPWGQTVAYIRDLDGVLISINSPMS